MSIDCALFCTSIGTEDFDMVNVFLIISMHAA